MKDNNIHITVYFKQLTVDELEYIQENSISYYVVPFLYDCAEVTVSPELFDDIKKKLIPFEFQGKFKQLNKK